MPIYWGYNSGYQGTVQHNLSKIKKILDSLHSNNIADAADWLRAWQALVTQLLRKSECDSAAMFSFQ